MKFPSVSVVVPTQNMSSHLRQLLESLISSETLTLLEDVIVVNDGSTDETEQILQKLLQDPFWKSRLKVLNFSSAQGRFAARREGALLSHSDLIFFIDSRVSLPNENGQELRQLLAQHSSLMGIPFIDTKKSAFNLYWDRSHRWIFRKNFEDSKKGFFLNLDNYEQYAKGTGLLIVPRTAFLEACNALGAGEFLADDTLLLREVVRKQPIFVCDQFTFEWEPRQTLKEFLWRLFDRGPGFVQYHFLTHRTRFFYASVLAFGFAIFCLSASFWWTSSLAMGVVILMVLASSSVLLMTRKPTEFLVLIPLHLLVLASFSLGVLYGLIYYLPQLFLRQEKAP